MPILSVLIASANKFVTSLRIPSNAVAMSSSFCFVSSVELLKKTKYETSDIIIVTHPAKGIAFIVADSDLQMPCVGHNDQVIGKEIALVGIVILRPDLLRIGRKGVLVFLIIFRQLLGKVDPFNILRIIRADEDPKKERRAKQN